MDVIDKMMLIGSVILLIGSIIQSNITILIGSIMLIGGAGIKLVE